MKYFSLFIVSGFLCLSLCVCLAAAQEGSVQKLERAKAILSAEAENPQESKQDASSGWRTVKEPSLGSASSAMFKSLMVCLGILLIGAAVYKKLYARKPQFGQKRIQVLERGQLNHRNFLALIQVEGKKVLVSYGADNASFFNIETAKETGGAQETFEESLKDACVRNP